MLMILKFFIKISARRPSDEGSVARHRLQWDPLPPNEVGRITQHIREGEGRKEESRDGEGITLDLIQENT